MGGESGIRNRSFVGTGEKSRILHPPRHSGLSGSGDLEGVDVVGETDKEGGRLVDRSPPGQQGGVGDKDPGHQQAGQHTDAVSESEALLAEHRHRPEVALEVRGAGVVATWPEQAGVDAADERAGCLAVDEPGDRRGLHPGTGLDHRKLRRGEVVDRPDVEPEQRGRGLVVGGGAVGGVGEIGGDERGLLFAGGGDGSAEQLLEYR